MNNSVVHEDCVSLMRKLSNESVDLIVADPPYGVGYHSNRYKDKNPHSPVSGDWNFQIGRFVKDALRVLKNDSALYLFCRWDVAPLWLPLMDGNGFKVKTIIIWNKNSHSAGDLKGSFGNKYEQIIFASKGRHILKGKRYTNVWDFPRVPFKKMLHPTQKPVELVERILECSSVEGDVILDPFAGSGTTGLACMNMGRNYILVDIDAKMVTLSQRRLGLPVTEAEEPVEESSSDPSFVPPDPAEWGLHPEQIAELWHEFDRRAS